MSDQSLNGNDNPLNEFASELSESLNSHPVDVDESAVDRIEGGQVRMKNSAARSVHASALHLDESAAGIIRTHTLDANESVMGFVTAQEVVVRDSTSSFVAANQVNIEESQAFAVFAFRLDGNVRTVFTLKTAVAAGAAFAAVFMLLTSLIGRIWPFSKNNQNK
ncbi:hypothetical protein KFU94_37685 [Chloroflexi bacterium TSY]|nr:hypothetical protein [Chloroflexi bacterium TSY]